MKKKKKDELDNWNWPQNRWTKVEFACPHGVGHGEELHGCDGCCRHSSYKLVLEERRKEYERACKRLAELGGSNKGNTKKNSVRSRKLPKVKPRRKTSRRKLH